MTIYDKTVNSSSIAALQQLDFFQTFSSDIGQCQVISFGNWHAQQQ
jgi:hypothetical protein